MFPNKKKTGAIYDEYKIDFVYVYQVLTDTDSTSLQFIIFCKKESKILEKMFREIIFKVIVKNKILERFDVSHEFWKQFGIRDPKTQKRLGLFQIEHIDDPCQVTIAVNPKEYIELFQSDNINKKHKGVSKGETLMDLSSFGKRINSVKDIENFGQLQKDTVNQNRFTVKNNEMILETVETSKFAQINDKSYYFENGIVSLPFSHPYLNKIV